MTKKHLDRFPQLTAVFVDDLRDIGAGNHGQRNAGCRLPESLMPPKPSPPPLISTRAALVVLLGLLCGMMAAALTFLAVENGPAAILVGLGALGGGISFFLRFIEW